MTSETALDQVAFAAGVLTLISILAAWRLRRIRLIFLPLILIAGLVAGVTFWYNHRPLPSAKQRMLFQGVEYIREIRPGHNDPLIIHIIRIDLTTPELYFLVTPHTPTNGHDQAARTTSTFLTEFGMSLAINADAFAPWYEDSVFNFYPHEGDPVNLHGTTISRGDYYTPGYSPLGSVPTLHISADNQVTINAIPDPPYNAVSGLHTLLEDGVIPDWGREDTYRTDSHPRTAAAVDQSGQQMLWIVVDGRQPNYSEGITLERLAEIALEYGAWDAVNLDGGGSTTLIMVDENKQPITLNSPIHTRVPGRQRPVGNHLGLIAPALPR